MLWSTTSHIALILVPSHFQAALVFLLSEDLTQSKTKNMNYSKASSQMGHQYQIATYIPFCIIAIAHSRWTLCEQGKIWHPLNASYKKTKNNERIIICIKMIRSSQYHEPVRWECKSIT